MNLENRVSARAFKIKRMDCKDLKKAEKRRFYENQYTVETNTNFTSASAEKLGKTDDDEILIHRQHGYCILEFFSIFSAISVMVMCRTCQSDIQFNETSTRGFGFKIAVTCKCGVKYINSCPLIDKCFEINRQIVMRFLGIGKRGIDLFCNLMDISQELHIEIFDACLENIHCASKEIYELVTKRAVEEEKQRKIIVENNYPMENLTISSDCWYKKQNFSSFFGIFTLLGTFSKKVLDTEIKSSYCQICNIWRQ